MAVRSDRTTIVIDTGTFKRLSNLGRRNERSASAEARVAIRNHLEKSASPASRAQSSRDTNSDAESSARG